MSEPEIARRCQTCGAAVRGTARFCPQCGQVMADERDGAATQTPSRAKSALVDQAERVANSLSGRLTALEPEAAGPADAVPRGPDAEPAAAARVAETFEVARPVEVAQTLATPRVGGPDAPLDAPVVESAPASEDDARAHAGMSATAERGAPHVSTGDAPPDAAPLTEKARAASAGGARVAGGVRRRAAAVGAGLGGSVRPRVEKLREASVVVLDEAAEDPGMRFVVIAALLFVIALLILLFSFVLR
ncbi:MAG TPA: zinc-ribbon domain-containing protein [Pyrinomonadaceae bacterium]|jgi:hypothetical protein|nr:zinc-ribbon domain-containing protein [Pyrinomonadaceae bacterium]